MIFLDRKFLGVLFLTLTWHFHHANAILPDNYQSMSAQAKSDILWAQIAKDPYVDLRNIDLSNIDLLKRSGSGSQKSDPRYDEGLRCQAQLNHTDVGAVTRTASIINPWFVNQAFNHISDEMLTGRKKVVHTHGSTAQIKWVPSDQKTFTGLFQTGGIGVARLSEAFPGGPFGLAIKILINGNPSVNFHVMNSLDAPSNRNCFSQSIFNIISSDRCPVQLAMRTGVVFPISQVNHPPVASNILPLQEAAHIRNNGSTEQNWVAPYRLELIPESDVKNIIPDETKEDFRVNLMRSKFKKGLKLYTVMAYSEGEDTGISVGHIELNSRWIASPYQDDVLYFQHQQSIPTADGEGKIEEEEEDTGTPLT